MLCFRNFLVAKKFLDNREGRYQDFLSKLLCLAVPKPFVEEPFFAVFQKFPGSEKVSG